MNPLDDDQYSRYLASQDDAMASGESYSTVVEAANALPSEVTDRFKQDVEWCEFVRSALTRFGDGPPAEAEGRDWFAGTSGPPRFGRFEVRRELGRGSFGVVFLAYDPRLRRQVALKVPRPDVLVSAEMRRRFEREARAAAGLDHPNVVPVFDSGEEGSVSFIASAYCPGPTLSAWLKARQGPVAPRLAARITLQVAGAIAHAHSRGVLHRDLKPGNVIMEPVPAGSSARGDHDGLNSIPRITDFGLARLVATEQEATAPTQAGAILGTPSYMAPEQAEGGGAAVGPTTDVYGLGAILYTLLVGRPPFQADSPIDTLLLLRTQDPIAPSRLRPRVPRDLETICLKCLSKEPRRRYASVDALADDLERFLAGRPIKARRIGAAGRIALWCRRQPALTATIATAILVIAAVASAGVWRVVRERDRYRAERDRAQLNLSHALTAEARAVIKARETGWMWTAFDNLRESARLAGPAADRSQNRELAIECFGSEYPCFRLAWARQVHTKAVTATAFSPDGALVASGSRDGTVTISAIRDDQPRAVLAGPEEGITGVAYHPKGGWLAASSADGSLRIWRVGVDGETGPPLTLLKDEAAISDVQFSPVGDLLATASARGLVRLIPFDAAALDPAARAKEQGRNLNGHTAYVGDLAFSAHGQLLASGSLDHHVCVWDVATGGLIRRIPVSNGRQTPRGLAFSHMQDDRDFRMTLTWGNVEYYGANWTECLRTTRIWHGEMFTGQITGLRQDSRGNLFTAGADGSLRLWRLPKRGTGNGFQSLATATDNFGIATAIDLSPDEDWVAVGYQDGRVRLWQLVEPLERTFLPDKVYNPVFAAKSRRLVSQGYVADFSTGIRPISEDYKDFPITAVEVLDGGGAIAFCREAQDVQIWDRRAGRELRRLTHASPVRALAVSANKAVLAAGSQDGTVKLWDWKQGPLLATLAPGAGVAASVGAARSIFWGKSDHELVVGYERGLALWDVARPDQRARWFQVEGPSPYAVAFAGDALATSAADGAIAILDPRSGQRRRLLRGHSSQVVALALSADGRRLVSIAADDTVRSWDTESGAASTVITREAVGGRFLALDRTGRYAVTDDSWERVVCDLTAGLVTARLRGHWAAGRFSADGSEFVVGDLTGGMHRYAIDPASWAHPGLTAPTAPGGEVELKGDAVVRGSYWPLTWGMAASPDGRWIATGLYDNIVQLRDARDVTQFRSLTRHSDLVWCVTFSPDSKLLASGSANGRRGEIKVWDVEQGREVLHREGHTGLVTGLAFVPGRPWLVSSSRDGTIRLWDTRSGEDLGLVHTMAGWVSGLSVRGDGRWLAAACHDGSIAVWEVSRLAALPAPPDQVLVGHNTLVHSVAFHPSGRWLASGSEQGAIMLWDGETFHRIVRLKAGTGQIRGVRFSGDGELLATYAYGAPTVVWNLPRLRRSLRELGLDW
jgi:WD40 repeat protein